MAKKILPEYQRFIGNTPLLCELPRLDRGIHGLRDELPLILYTQTAYLIEN
jgi:hypothetical protein